MAKQIGQLYDIDIIGDGSPYPVKVLKEVAPLPGDDRARYAVQPMDSAGNLWGHVMNVAAARLKKHNPRSWSFAAKAPY
jgi:hypothetical protein